jgi:hypothetical protein
MLHPLSLARNLVDTTTLLAAQLRHSQTSLHQPCFGLELSFYDNEIRFKNPVLPEFVDEMVIRNLQLGDTIVDLRIHSYGRDVTANVLSRVGTAKIAVLK